MDAASVLLSLRGVGKKYDVQPVLQGVSLDIQSGEAWWLSAPNGSGKTTLLEILAGLSKPTSGTRLWLGQPWERDALRAVGVVLQEPMVYGELTGFENLVFFADLFDCAHPNQVAERWLNEVGIYEARHQRVRTYSKGMRQRLALARALLHDPKLVLLDEPFDGVDSEGVLAFTRILTQCLERGTALFMVSHTPPPMDVPLLKVTLDSGRLVFAT